MPTAPCRRHTRTEGRSVFAAFPTFAILGAQDVQQGGSSPPPPVFRILTEGGDPITTEGGDPLRTETP